jgi:putative ABC transport system permease protein
MVSGLAQDFSLAVRAATGSRLVSTVAVMTLALAMGANTAVFSLVDHLLVRNLPVSKPEQLVSVTSELAISHGFTAGAGWSAAMWDQLRQRSALFGGALAWYRRSVTLGRAADAEPVDALYVNGEFFSTLGVPALHGRVISTADDVPGAGVTPVAVVSYRLWQRRFAGAPNVIGTPIDVEGIPVTIVGVAPKQFAGLELGRGFDIALPIAAESFVHGKHAAIGNPRTFLLLVMLRLKEGQSLESATRTLRSLQREIVPANAPAFASEPFTLVPAAGGAANPGAPQRLYRRPLLMLFAGVAVVLVIACLNIANLLLARAMARHHQLSVRVALGASRWQLARPLLLESLLLAAAGAIGGLILALWIARAMAALTTVALDLSLDWRIAAFTAALTLVSALLVSLTSAFRTTRVEPADALKVDGRGVPGGASRLSNGLQVLQVALALVLLVAAGLLVRSFVKLATAPLGFQADRVLVVRVDTARTAGGSARHYPLYQQLSEVASAVPGVERAAASSWTPMSGEGAVVGLRASNAGAGSSDVNVLANFVTPDWFSVYGIPLKQGRDFARHDTATSPRVVIVNEAFVRRFSPNGSALGTIVEDQTIVGIVGDAVSRSAQRIPGVASLALREPVPPTMYVPLEQASHWDRPAASSVVRLSIDASTGSTAALVPSLRKALIAVDPNLVLSFRRLTDDISSSLAQERMLAVLSAFFAIVALILAALGLYGLMSYASSRRTMEIGIRVALGATRLSVVRLILGRALLTIAAGTLLGVFSAGMFTRRLSGFLFGVTPLDPATFIGVAVLVGAVGTIAAFIPAYRASRIDPVVALRASHRL